MVALETEFEASPNLFLLPEQTCASLQLSDVAYFSVVGMKKIFSCSKVKWWTASNYAAVTYLISPK